MKKDRVAYLDQRVDVYYDDHTLLENLTQVTSYISDSDRRIRPGWFLFDLNRVGQKAFFPSSGERL